MSTVAREARKIWANPGISVQQSLFVAHQMQHARGAAITCAMQTLAWIPAVVLARFLRASAGMTKAERVLAGHAKLCNDIAPLAFLLCMEPP